MKDFAHGRDEARRERESYPYPPYVIDMVRVRLSAEGCSEDGSGRHRSPPAWFTHGMAARIERHHSADWDGVYGEVQKRLVVDDPDDTHPYLVQCLFPGQAVPLDTSAWFSAWELVEPTNAEKIDQLRKCGAWPWPGDHPA